MFKTGEQKAIQDTDSCLYLQKKHKPVPPNVAYMQHSILLKLYTIFPNVAREQHSVKGFRSNIFENSFTRILRILRRFQIYRFKNGRTRSLLIILILQF